MTETDGHITDRYTRGQTNDRDGQTHHRLKGQKGNGWMDG